MQTYLNIPATFPMNKAAAYRKAVELFSVDDEEVRREYAGITWQNGSAGEQFAEWSDLPAARR